MRNKLKEIFILILSSFLISIAVNWFFAGFYLMPGGITGLSILISSLSGISVDKISLFISIPLLLFSLIILGNKFGFKTLFITLLIPLFIKIIPKLNVTNSIAVASIVGGALVGISIGLAIYSGCATGGTDVIAIIVNKFLKCIKVEIILFVLDISIVLSSYIVSKQIITAIYSALSLFIIINSIKITLKKLRGNINE